MVQFSATQRVGSSYFITGLNSCTFDTTNVNKKVTPSSCNKQTFLESSLKNYTWMDMYNRNGNYMYCKICMKAKKSNRMRKQSQGRNFQNTVQYCTFLTCWSSRTANDQIVFTCYLSQRSSSTTMCPIPPSLLAV